MTDASEHPHLKTVASNPHLVRTPPTCGALHVIFQDRSPQANNTEEPLFDESDDIRYGFSDDLDAFEGEDAEDISMEQQYKSIAFEDEWDAAQAQRIADDYAAGYGSEIMAHVNPHLSRHKPCPSFKQVMKTAFTNNLKTSESLHVAADHFQSALPEYMHISFKEALEPLKEYGHCMFKDRIVPHHVIHAALLADEIDLKRNNLPRKAYRLSKKANRILENDCHDLDKATANVKAVVYASLMSEIKMRTEDCQQRLADELREKNLAKNVQSPEYTEEDYARTMAMLHYIAEQFIQQSPQQTSFFNIKDTDDLLDAMVTAIEGYDPSYLFDANEEDAGFILDLTTDYLIATRTIPENFQNNAESPSKVTALLTHSNGLDSLADCMNNIPCTNAFEQALHERAAKLHRLLLAEKGIEIKEDLASITPIQHAPKLRPAPITLTHDPS